MDPTCFMSDIYARLQIFHGLSETRVRLQLFLVYYTLTYSIRLGLKWQDLLLQGKQILQVRPRVPTARQHSLPPPHFQLGSSKWHLLCICVEEQTNLLLSRRSILQVSKLFARLLCGSIAGHSYPGPHIKN